MFDPLPEARLCCSRSGGHGTNACAGKLFWMNHKQEMQAIEFRERRIDEALKETFPASDPVSFIGAGAQKPTDHNATEGKPRNEAADIAAVVIDQQADQSATSEEQERRKRRLLKGPKEFRDLRRDHPNSAR